MQWSQHEAIFNTKRAFKTTKYHKTNKMDTTSKEESEQFEPEIQSLQDEGSGTIDDDDEDEIEELHKR